VREGGRVWKEMGPTLGRALPFLAVAFFAAADARAQGKPLVRAMRSPKTVTVGQPVTLTVDVFVPTWFTSAPRFPQIEVKDAIVVVLDQSGTDLSEMIGETSYAGLRREYLIYPQRAGNFEIPRVEVQVRYAIDAQPSPRTSVFGQASPFVATVPEAAAGLGYFVAATNFDLSAATDRPLEGLKVGDSVTRTVTMTADNSFAMMLPPLPETSLDGVAVYPSPKHLSDSGGERDTVRVGKRTESSTYVLQHEGAYRLPPVEVAWWDINARVLRRARLEPVDFAVAAGTRSADEIPLPPEPATAVGESALEKARDAVARYSPLVLAVLLVLALSRRRLAARLGALRERYLRRRQERAETLAAYFTRVEQAARTDDRAQLMAATYQWLDRQDGAGTASASARLDEFARASGDPELPGLAASLVDTATGYTADPPAGWSAARFVASLRRAARRPAVEPPTTAGLGPLNPRS
jgi:hypothetical protein